MIIETINSPQDLKKLSLEKLRLLSQEIRNLIVNVVSNRGGHLASSLGTVELCVALHYCFNTPTDSLIFDVGHQTYAHKIITGRRDSFHLLRSFKGLSGFPNCRESEYDTYISGHASTAVSWAQGLAEGKKLNGDCSKTVAIIGDGSLTGGMCFEAFNSAGHAQSDILVIVNHNEMSISPSVGALSRYLTKLISAPIYNRIKNELESFLKHFPLAKKVADKAGRFEEALKGLLIPGIFFEELGFRYFGPINGHDFETLIPTIKNVMALKGPRVLHLVTTKGKGHKLSEENPEDFHSASAFGLNSSKKSDSFSEVFAKKLIEIGEKNKKVVAITAAMPKGTGLNLFQEKFPDRLFDVGIAEEHAVGFASGLAKQGLLPVVAIYSTFLQRAFDQLIHDVALQGLKVIFAVDRAGIVGEDGPTHHGLFDVGYLRLVPDMICLAPKDKEELEDMLDFSLNQSFSVSIRYPRGKAYSLGNRSKIELAKSQVLHQGKDCCIVALGSMVREAVQCRKLLLEEKIDVGLVNARFIKPIDKELLINLAKEYSLIVTLEEANLNGGFGSAVLELFQSAGCLSSVKVVSFGFPDAFIPAGSCEELFKMYGLDGESLAERIKNVLKSAHVSSLFQSDYLDL